MRGVHFVHFKFLSFQAPELSIQTLLFVLNTAHAGLISKYIFRPFCKWKKIRNQWFPPIITFMLPKLLTELLGGRRGGGGVEIFWRARTVEIRDLVQKKKKKIKFLTWRVFLKISYFFIWWEKQGNFQYFEELKLTLCIHKNVFQYSTYFSSSVHCFSTHHSQDTGKARQEDSNADQSSDL